MIQRFVDRYMARQHQLRQRFAAEHPETYTDIMHALIETISPSDDGLWGPDPDPDRITVIDHGNFTGIVFIVAETGDEPDYYWATKVGYGSECDILQQMQTISRNSDQPPTDGQIDKYMTLALHLLLGLRLALQDES